MLIAVKVQISKPLCMLFNKSLHQNIFPTDWKLAHVIPLFKAGDKSFPSNYRPVSLLSCVSKLLEKIVFKHIFNHLQGNKLLCKFQSGFLPGCSTTHQLVELYISKISCSLTIICERTFLHLTSKGGRSLFLSFRSETEQKCLFNIPAFSKQS
jgi:hypothetical protein